ncbi:MAG: penicillin-binding protein 2 [Aeromicrobium sp.]|nr:penicillin-binding protein 2 [Burkholderiales bacterium]
MNHTSKKIQAPELRLKLEGWRSRLALVGCLALFALLLGRAFYLQGVNNDFLQAKGESRFVRVVDMPASRGAVLDRNGKPLAISTPVESIWASPADVNLDDKAIIKLASALNVDKNVVADRFADKEKNFVWLKRQLSPEQAARVIALKTPGVFQQREYRRFYPAGDVTAHVIGFTGMDDQGQEGIELAQQESLAGVPGQRRVIKDRKGRIVEDLESLKVPRDGRPLKLSIDERFQFLAHRELKAAVESNRAKSGALVMLDAKTGEVLALVNMPDYNPNNRAAYKPAQMRNRSVADTFEPGSTFKPFAVAAALEAGIVKPSTVITTGSGLSVGGHTITDTHPLAQMTVAEIIQKSSNIGTAKMALQLPPETLWSLYSGLGFGSSPRTGFPGEVSGKLRPAKTWKPIEQATMSYGYGLSVSALQIARAYTLFTNDGVLLPVTFNKREAEVIGKQVLSPATAKTMAAMLETVTQQGGTATKGQVPGYRVAGKTGTARKLVNGQYSQSLYLSSFVGYGPASNPRFIMAVTIDEPSAGKIYGGEVSAPVFSNVMAQAFRMAGVQPDAPSLADATRPTPGKATNAVVVLSPEQRVAPIVARPAAAQVAPVPKDRG